MEFLKNLFENVTANIVATVLMSFIVVVMGWLGFKKSPEGGDSKALSSVKIRNGNYVAIDGDGNQVHQYTTQTTTNINQNYGAQRAQVTGDDTSEFAWAVVLGVIVIGGILTAARYLHHITQLPLWAGGITTVGSLIFLAWQRASYSAVARKKVLVSVLTLAASSIFFSKTINTVQSVNNTYSLGRVAQEVESTIPTDAGWMTAFFKRTGTFLISEDSTYRVALVLALMGLTFSALVFVMALQRVLGAMLLPSTSAGHVYRWKTINALNNSFVESKYWGYGLLILVSYGLWWTTTDLGAEFWVQRFIDFQELVKNLADTAQ